MAAVSLGVSTEEFIFSITIIMLLWSQPRVESPRHAVANLMCVECGKLVACTDECVYILPIWQVHAQCT